MARSHHRGLSGNDCDGNEATRRTENVTGSRRARARYRENQARANRSRAEVPRADRRASCRARARTTGALEQPRSGWHPAKARTVVAPTWNRGGRFARPASSARRSSALALSPAAGNEAQQTERGENERRGLG